MIKSKAVQIVTTVLLALSATVASARQPEDKQSLADLEFLLGEWTLETNYANGAKANGTRECRYALRKTRIRCATESLFADGSARDLVSYFSYNASTNQFQEMTIYQRPVGNKVADLLLDIEEDTGMSRGYVYGGDGTSGPRVSEEWAISATSITMTMRLNRGGQPAHIWSVFIEETMARTQ